MIRGLYTACSGMMVQMTRQDVLANNLANVNTSGFKKDTVISQEFPSMLIKRMGEVTWRNSLPQPVKPQNIGSLGTVAAVYQIVTDYSTGAYKATENPWDLALGQDCFFCIETPEGVRYTRNGAFTVASDRRLVNANGQPVLGINGYIYVDGDFVVDEHGNLVQGGVTVDTLDIVRFPDQTRLTKIGDDLFAAGDEEPETPDNPQVIQGYLESSNVNAVKEMVDLITVVRAYEVMHKVIQAEDQTLDKLINQAGSR
ncbi:MAG: flagellar basal-body rod protein FlgF [Bacillota bacterium]